jgi:hypothetical protein
MAELPHGFELVDAADMSDRANDRRRSYSNGHDHGHEEQAQKGTQERRRGPFA